MAGVTKPECVDCAVLPTLPIGSTVRVAAPEGLYRPSRPRPIDPRSGPRSPRCATHQNALIKAQRDRAAVKYQERHHGMPADVRVALRAIQGDKCPCGNKIVDTDHDHDIAREECEHPVAQSCRRCWRGLTCRMCNRFILGRGYTAKRLRAIADYLDNPPAWQLDPEDY